MFISYSVRKAILYSNKRNNDICKDYFVLTTNVDHQFFKAGFEEKRIFATQGDYGMIQCEKGCHQKIYDAEELFCRMDQERKDCLIPSDLVPKCPVCGGDMAMHLRCDQYFVEDEAWHEAAYRYGDFLEKWKAAKVFYWNWELDLTPRPSSGFRLKKWPRRIGTSCWSD